MGHDYWIVFKISGNERSGDETNEAEKIVFELRTLSTDFTSSGRLTGIGEGRTTSPLHRFSLATTLTNLPPPTHSKRLATLAAQPVAIRLSLVVRETRFP